jgi:quercetin dioxygenase-like cupin family protein
MSPVPSVNKNEKIPCATIPTLNFLSGETMKIFLIRTGLVLILVAALLALGRSQQSQQQLKTQRIPQFENDNVKVWRSVIAPNAPLTMHRHDHPRVIVALTGGTMRIVEQDGPAESHLWETGKAYWLPANPPNTMHADVNKGPKPIEVMVVELKHEK